ncbi:MAG: hypothetical protein H7338_24980 [Candidatus Sericytochromatia bacterium]|nr:hypothetical protein [Candidatus Sericytochromatia bacterium]
MTRFGSATLSFLAVAGCLAAATPTAPSGGAATPMNQPSAEAGTTAAYGSTRRGVDEAAAALSSWLGFETGSRANERLLVAGDVAGDQKAGLPAPTAAAAPAPQPMASAVPPGLVSAPLSLVAGVLPAVGGTDNGDGSVTVTKTRQGIRPEGPYTEILALTYAKQTRLPITYRHRLTVTQAGRTTLSQSRSKVWQPDGRFTESVALSGLEPARDGTMLPWRMDATTQAGAAGGETTIGTLRRSDGTALTISRTRQAGHTTLDVTDSRQNLKLSGSSDNAQEIAILTILIEGKTTGTVTI